MSKFLTIKDIAKQLRVSERTIYRFVESGKLKAIKLSRGTTRIAESDFKRFIKKHKTK